MIYHSHVPIPRRTPSKIVPSKIAPSKSMPPDLRASRLARKTLLVGLLGLVACQVPDSQPQGLAPDAAQASLAQREHLTPVSKGERGIVTGQLLLPDKLPAAGALIRIEGTPYQTRADAQGQFEIAGAPIGSRFSLLAESLSEDGQSQKARLVSQIPSGQQRLKLESLLLSPTGSVSGQIRLSDGSSPLGIDVFVPGSSLVAKTDAEGNFALSQMPEGYFRLTALKAGYLPAESSEFEIVAGQISRLPLQNLRPTVQALGSASLSGQISSKGEPVVGAQVALIGDSLNASQLTLTDSQGRYQFEAVIPRSEPYTLLVSRSFYTSLETQLELKANTPSTQDLELVADLLTLGRLQVSVTNCSGQPVASALIQLDPAPALNPVSFSDSRGQARLSRLLPGPYTVYAARGEQVIFTGITIDNQPLGSDQQLGALAKANLVLGSPCPE